MARKKKTLTEHMDGERPKRLMRLHPFLTCKKPERYPEQGAMF